MEKRKPSLALGFLLALKENFVDTLVIYRTIHSRGYQTA